MNTSPGSESVCLFQLLERSSKCSLYFGIVRSPGCQDLPLHHVCFGSAKDIAAFTCLNSQLDMFERFLIVSLFIFYTGKVAGSSRDEICALFGSISMLVKIVDM